MSQMTPREIVSELDRYIVGQRDAKRAVAIALRNRWRRQQVPEELRDEIAPKNIIMIGPTGVGKTEIARRLAKLAQAPFLKVEASKFTEVGYVGRDVESMIRDLVELAIKHGEGRGAGEGRSASARAGRGARARSAPAAGARTSGASSPMGERRRASGRGVGQRRRARSCAACCARASSTTASSSSRSRKSATPMVEVFTPQGMEEMEFQHQGHVRQPHAEEDQEAARDGPRGARDPHAGGGEQAGRHGRGHPEAIRRVEQSGIVFIDEIDKIAGREGGGGPDVSREGVQRDLLPIVEGSTVNTKYGMVRTDHILFIASGAFHMTKPSDLIPELQGRFPIRVELEPLTREDFVRILTEPQNALIKQYVALMETEGVQLAFRDDAIDEIARDRRRRSTSAPRTSARAGCTPSWSACSRSCRSTRRRWAAARSSIDAAYVRDKLDDIVKNEDLSRYIL